MKTILVTGCAGFIGSNVIKKLLNEGYFVVGLDNLCDSYNPSWKLENISCYRKNRNFVFVKGDILNARLLEKLFIKYNINNVIHLAAKTGVRSSILQPLSYQEVNIRGTLNLLESSKKNGIKKFIFASSSSVYGNQMKIPFEESDVVNSPISPYAVTKIAGEMMCYTYSHLYKLPTICLRLFTVYGPNGRPDMAPYLFTEAIMNGKKIHQFGDGSSIRDYTYIDDVVEGIVSSLTYKCHYEIINIGNGQKVTLQELIQTLEKITGKQAQIGILGPQEGDVQQTSADITKANKLLQYSPKTDLVKGLQLFQNWYIKNRFQ